MNRTVAAVLMFHNKERSKYVWLANRTSGPLELRGLWECPAGKAELNEAPSTCALRELKEETGLVIDRQRLVPRGSLVMAGLSSEMQVEVFLYQLELYANEQPRETEKDKRSCWIPYPIERVGLALHHLGYEVLTPATAALVRSLRVESGLVG